MWYLRHSADSVRKNLSQDSQLSRWDNFSENWKLGSEED